MDIINLSQKRKNDINIGMGDICVGRLYQRFTLISFFDVVVVVFDEIIFNSLLSNRSRSNLLLLL